VLESHFEKSERCDFVEKPRGALDYEWKPDGGSRQILENGTGFAINDKVGRG